MGSERPQVGEVLGEQWTSLSALGEGNDNGVSGRASTGRGSEPCAPPRCELIHWLNVAGGQQTLLVEVSPRVPP